MTTDLTRHLITKYKRGFTNMVAEVLRLAFNCGNFLLLWNVTWKVVLFSFLFKMRYILIQCSFPDSR